MAVNLNNCKPGDKLLTSLDSILVYIGKTPKGSPYPHEVMYPDGTFGTRNDDGTVYSHNRLPTDHDIVEVVSRDHRINDWKNPAEDM